MGRNRKESGSAPAAVPAGTGREQPRPGDAGPHSPTQAMRVMSSWKPSKQSQVYPSGTRTQRPFSQPLRIPHSSACSPSKPS